MRGVNCGAPRGFGRNARKGIKPTTAPPPPASAPSHPARSRAAWRKSGARNRHAYSLCNRPSLQRANAAVKAVRVLGSDFGTPGVLHVVCDSGAVPRANFTTARLGWEHIIQKLLSATLPADQIDEKPFRIFLCIRIVRKVCSRDFQKLRHLSSISHQPCLDAVDGDSQLHTARGRWQDAMCIVRSAIRTLVKV